MGVRVAPENTEKLRALWDTELRYRRIFVAGAFGLVERQPCLLVIQDPAGAEFSVEAEVVYVKPEEPGLGVGLDVVGLGPERLAELEAFVGRAMDAVVAEVISEEDTAEELVAEAVATEASAGEPVMAAADEALAGEPAAPAGEASAGEPATPAGEGAARPERRSRELARPTNIFESMRKLGLRERDRVARQGQLSERIALERIFGSSVWESLLQNTGLTIPEVAAIARKGTLPQPLVAAIVANGSWLASGEVRRALMSNPRVSGAHLDRVLKATPKNELKQIAQMSPYRSQVRAAAKKLANE